MVIYCAAGAGEGVAAFSCSAAIASCRTVGAGYCAAADDCIVVAAGCVAATGQVLL